MSQTKAQLIDPTDGSIVNADINASAAIAGSKISPDFGSQNIVTTGETTTSDIFLGDSILHTGDTDTKIRFPAADTVSINTAGAERLRVDSSGRVGIGVTNPDRELDISNSSGNCTISLRSSDSHTTQLLFGDVSAELRGRVGYQSSDVLDFYTAAAERMRIDSSGNIGIGTSSPDSKLVVSQATTGALFKCITTNNNTRAQMRLVGKDGSGNDVTLILGGDGDVGGNVFTLTNHKLGFATNNAAPQMTLDTSGHLGIGDTSPNELLTLRDATPRIRLEDSDTTNAACQFVGDNANVLIQADTAGVVNDSNISFAIDGGEKMRIDKSGRLLIGLTTDLSGDDASAKLQVMAAGGGTMRLVRDDLTVTNGEYLGRIAFSGRDGGANVSCAQIIAEATETHSSSARGTRFRFFLTKDTENTPYEAMNLSSGGKLGIGGSAARMFSVSVPSTQGNIGVAEFANNKSDNNSAVLFMSTLRDGNSGESFLQCNKDQNNDGTGVAATVFIRTNGDFDSATNSYGGISDIKLKENIVDAKSQWDDIKNLRIRNFNFKMNPSQKMLGLVAQEVETVCPYLVKEAKDENLTSSNSGDEGTTTKSVKYSILYMKAIKALQEAIAKIETLETEVAALKAA